MPMGTTKQIIVQAWKWGLVLGKTDLWVQNGQVIDYAFELVPINLKVVEKSLMETQHIV